MKPHHGWKKKNSDVSFVAKTGKETVAANEPHGRQNFTKFINECVCVCVRILYLAVCALYVSVSFAFMKM